MTRSVLELTHPGRALFVLNAAIGRIGGLAAPMPALGQSAPIAKPFVRYSDKLKAGDSVKASDEGGGGIHHHTRMFETLGDKARRLYAEWCAEGLAPDEIEARLDHEPKGVASFIRDLLEMDRERDDEFYERSEVGSMGAAMEDACPFESAHWGAGKGDNYERKVLIKDAENRLRLPSHDGG